MQYFKHMTNMRNDIKIKRLISRYGLEGYGLYNLIIESIVENISTDNPLPELTETCADIAEFYNGNAAKINEIMAFMLNQGLFELDEITGRVLCNKVYKFLEQSQTRSLEIRNLISEYKNRYLITSETVTDKSDRKEEKRIRKEKNRTESKVTVYPSLDEVKQYINDKNLKVNANTFYTFFSESNWIDSKGKKVLNWKQKLLTWNSYSKPEDNKPDPMEKYYV